MRMNTSRLGRLRFMGEPHVVAAIPLMRKTSGGVYHVQPKRRRGHGESIAAFPSRRCEEQDSKLRSKHKPCMMLLGWTGLLWTA